MTKQPPVPNDRWEAIEPLLPTESPKPKGSRPRIPDRAAFAGIVLVLRAGRPWRLLPKELGRARHPVCRPADAGRGIGNGVLQQALIAPSHGSRSARATPDNQHHPAPRAPRSATVSTADAL